MTEEEYFDFLRQYLELFAPYADEEREILDLKPETTKL